MPHTHQASGRPVALRTLLAALLGLLLLLAACEAEEAAEEPADDDAAPVEDDDAEADDEAEEAEEEAADVEPDADAEPITIYSGRSEELVGPILEEYAEDTGVEVEVRYGDTTEMAATILEEGQNSPADLFFGQDAGALGALKIEGRLVDLPDATLASVDERFADPDGRWVGTSGRARVIAYNTDAVDEGDLPGTILDVTDPEWEGRVGWAPTNGSFQAHVTGMRVELGDEVVEEWVTGLDEVGVAYENNTAIVEALGRGEVDVGITNHYYLYRFLEEDPDFPVENAFFTGADIGNLVNIAGVGVLDTAEDPEAVFDLVDFLLTEEAQAYFADEVFEFPLVPGVPGDPRLPAIEEIETPDVDLSDLEDLQGTVDLLQRAGALP